MPLEAKISDGQGIKIRSQLYLLTVKEVREWKREGGLAKIKNVGDEGKSG